MATAAATCTINAYLGSERQFQKQIASMRVAEQLLEWDEGEPQPDSELLIAYTADIMKFSCTRSGSCSIVHASACAPIVLWQLLSEQWRQPHCVRVTLGHSGGLAPADFNRAAVSTEPSACGYNNWTCSACHADNYTLWHGRRSYLSVSSLSDVTTLTVDSKRESKPR